MKIHSRRWLTCLFLVAVPLAGRGADEAGDAKQWFDDATEKMRARQFAEAVPLLEKLHAARPDSAAVVWNLGTAYAELERNEEALVCWQQMRKLEPGNWQSTAKVVQALQALGRLEERDRVIARLLAERKENQDPQLARQRWFCREQFNVGDQKVLAVEYFEPTAPRAVFVAFVAPGPDGKELFRYSLGSYDTTTQMARDLKDIGPTDRLYHLDYYENHEQVHRTYGFFRARPEYATLRDQVVKAMKAEIKPVSGSTAPASPAAEKK
jgi:tetratricopeptide (TPR) repeat protein